MRDNESRHLSRRQLLAKLGAVGAAGLAGCPGGDGTDQPTVSDRPIPTATTPTQTPRRERTPTQRHTSTQERTATPTAGPEQPPRRVADRAVQRWGKRLNEHARNARIDWDQFSGVELTFGMPLHHYGTTIETVSAYFEALTGIEVEFDVFTYEQYWLEGERRLADGSTHWDGLAVGLWPAASYHYGDGDRPWLRDLGQYVEDASRTDTDWLAMDDFREQTLNQLTFPDGEDGEDFVGFPNTVQAYGCVAIDVPTFERLGLTEPTTVGDLEHAAEVISESEEVDREGIVSRASSSTLSSANWATLFKTYGADWIDRRNEAAALDEAAPAVTDSAKQVPDRYLR